MSAQDAGPYIARVAQDADLAAVVLDLATREPQPSPVEANRALRVVSPVVRCYELTDGRLHVRDARDSAVAWTPLGALAERMLG